MGKEIEFKYLPADDFNIAEIGVREANYIEQGYVAKGDLLVRVRICGIEAFLTLKDYGDGVVRNEWEYPIPLREAEEMLRHTKNKIQKIRNIVFYENHAWEVDTFLGKNEGLIIAEIEVPNVDTTYPIPPWVGKQVTDEKYINVNLIDHPYCDWSEDERD